jgi:peptidyl-prolyl cis-trans isomerase D
MFDLFRSRDKSVRLMLGGLLLVVAVSMLTYLVPNYDTNGPTAGLVLASVGDQEIRADLVQKQVQNAMRGKSLPPDMLPIYIPQIVDGIITSRALVYYAEHELGFKVSDEQLRTTLQQIYPVFFPEGRFVGKDQYVQILAKEGISPAEFEDDTRRQILIARLNDVAVEGTVVTPLEVEQAFKKKYEQIKIDYVKIIGEKYKASLTPTDAEMRSYYQANQANWQTPERKSLVFLVADQAKIEQTINIPDEELRKIYTQNQARYHVPEQATVRHILFMTQGKPPADDEKIKAQAQDVLNQIKSGKLKFEDAVTKYSEDPGSKDKGGVYANVQHDQMTKEFDQATFSQKVGDITLVKSSFGYHILQVQSREPAHQQTFEEVKAQVASEAKKGQVNQVLQRASDQAQTALAKDPNHPDKVAADLGLQVVRVDDYEPGKAIPEIGTNPDLDQAIAALKIAQVTPAIALAQTKLAVAELTGITPPKPQPYEEVKEKVKQQMLVARLPIKVSEVAKQLLTKAKVDGNLEKAAKDEGLKVESTQPFIRTDTVLGFGSANYIGQGFNSPDGSILGPILMPDGTVVAKVVAHVPADMSKFAAERPTIRDQIKGQKAGERDTLFREGLKDRLIKEGKVKIHQDAINKLIASYRNL